MGDTPDNNFLSEEGLRDALFCTFNRLNFASWAEVDASVQRLHRFPEYLSRIRNSLRRLILDRSMSFWDKADKYIDEQLESEEEADDLFRFIWQKISDDAVFPLDEKKPKRRSKRKKRKKG